MANISVIIPLYNKAAYINRAIQSVLSQTRQAYEIIIVNDGSTDNGPTVAESTGDDRIRVLHKQNAGVSSARNLGVEQAKGDFVSFLDADDEWHPNFLEVMQTLINSFPDAGLYATAYEIVTRRGNRRKVELRYIPSHSWKGYLPSYFKAAAFGEPPVWTSASCIPKHIIKRVGLFQCGKRMGEDLDLWGRIAIHHQTAYCTEVYATYCQNAENRACDARFEVKDEHPFIESGLSALSAENLDLQITDDLKTYIDRLILENARLHVLAGNYTRAQELSKLYKTKNFLVRKMMWSTWVNRFTHVIWKLMKS